MAGGAVELTHALVCSWRDDVDLLVNYRAMRLVRAELLDLPYVGGDRIALDRLASSTPQA